MFNKFVEITEPICHEIDKKKADYLIYDTAGFESYVAETIPNFLILNLNKLKNFLKLMTLILMLQFILCFLAHLILILKFANNILMVIFAMS